MVRKMEKSYSQDLPNYDIEQIKRANTSRKMSFQDQNQLEKNMQSLETHLNKQMLMDKPRFGHNLNLNKNHTKNNKTKKNTNTRVKISCKKLRANNVKCMPKESEGSIMEASKDFKGMLIKCTKLSIDPLQLVSQGHLHVGRGRITQIHYQKGIGQIQLSDSEQQVRFHKIDFMTNWWLVTVAFALKLKFSFIYSSYPTEKYKDSKELLLVDHDFFQNLKSTVNKHDIKKSNYQMLLDMIPDLPLMMNKFKEMMINKKLTKTK